MPGKRLGKMSPIALRNSALAGIAATRLPSFLAASTVFPQSVWDGGRASPARQGVEISGATKTMKANRGSRSFIHASQSCSDGFTATILTSQSDADDCCCQEIPLTKATKALAGSLCGRVGCYLERGGKQNGAQEKMQVMVGHELEQETSDQRTEYRSERHPSNKISIARNAG